MQNCAVIVIANALVLAPQMTWLASRGGCGGAGAWSYLQHALTDTQTVGLPTMGLSLFGNRLRGKGKASVVLVASLASF